MEGDKKVTQHYKDEGWKIKRIWEHQLRKTNFENTIDELSGYIQEIKRNQ